MVSGTMVLFSTLVLRADVKHCVKFDAIVEFQQQPSFVHCSSVVFRAPHGRVEFTRTWEQLLFRPGRKNGSKICNPF